MPQAITPAMVTALASKLQIGAAKRFQGEIEIDYVRPSSGGGASPLLAYAAAGWRYQATALGAGGSAFAVPGFVDAGWALGAAPFIAPWDSASAAAAGTTFAIGHDLLLRRHVTVPGGLTTLTLHFATRDRIWIYWNGALMLQTDAFRSSPSSLPTGDEASVALPIVVGDNVLAIRISDDPPGGAYIDARVEGDEPAGDAIITTAAFVVETMTIDRSRAKGAAQLDVTLPNVDGQVGYYTQPNPYATPNNPIRAYAWYGVRANRVQVFTGLLDRDTDHRDPDVTTVDLKARGRTKLLLAPHVFVATAPQGAGETGAVRTEANGVFLNRSPEYIAGAVLDLAGWPAADRALSVSGVTIPEFDLADGGQWLDQIASAGKLTTIVGWDAGEDELGVFQFGPNLLAAALEPDPDWTFEPGLNVLAYDHQVDDEERVTRVRVSGPMSSTVPIWKEEWGATFASSANLGHPTGVMYRASEPDYLYVVDRITGFLCKVRQSDRVITAKWDLGPSLTNQPIGLSGDPTDSSTFYVLDAHLPGSGTYTNCKVRKFTFATKALAATTSLPDGQWSDMKFDGTHLWLTNFGDDKLYEKTFVGGGTAGATANFSYAGHTNPTGMYLSGTTIGLFFNGGAAFYLVGTSAPGTITGTQSTKGTHIEGGEIDTTTGVDLYAVASAGEFGNTAGYVWKFALAEQITVNVVKWATDVALEDAMGLQAGLASRIHDLHPGDGAHAWERRDKLVTLVTVNTEDQAQAVADALLTLAKRLRRTQDLVTIGNPAIQLGDAIEYPDTVAGSDAIWMLDTKRESLTAGQYVTSMSVLPWEAP